MLRNVTAVSWQAALKKVSSFMLMLFVALGMLESIAHCQNDREVIPLPAFEFESVVTQWLIGSGHEILRQHGREGTRIITATRGSDRWKITVTPKSSLASAVHVEYTLSGTVEPEKHESLWNYINRYLQATLSHTEPSREKAPEFLHAYSKSIVCIDGTVNDRQIQFTGFLLDSDGIIMSTAHDVAGIQELTVTFHDGSATSGRVMKADSLRDMMLLDIKPVSYPSISLLNSRNLLEEGEMVYSLGCPMNHNGQFHSGFIEGAPRRIDNLLLWQVRMGTLPGSSGSPVFDAKGNLVGIVKGSFRGAESTGFIITIGSIIEFLSAL